MTYYRVKPYKWYQLIMPRLFGKFGKWTDKESGVCLHFLIYKGNIFITKIEDICDTGQDLKRSSQNGLQKTK